MALLHHPAMELRDDLNHIISLGFSGDLHFGSYFHSCGLSIVSFDKIVLIKIIADICNCDNTAKKGVRLGEKHGCSDIRQVFK